MHFVDYVPLGQGRQLLRLPVCIPAQQVPSENGSILKGNNSLTMGVNCFLLEWTFFSEGMQNEFERVICPKVYKLLLNLV